MSELSDLAGLEDMRDRSRRRDKAIGWCGWCSTDLNNTGKHKPWCSRERKFWGVDIGFEKPIIVYFDEASKIPKGKYMINKKPKAPKPPKDLLSILLQLITSMYPDDRLAPGIVQSYIGNQERKFHGSAVGDYYASVKRYPARTVVGNEGQQAHSVIVVTAYGASAAEALKKLATQIQQRTVLSAHLGKALRAKA